MFDQRIFSDKVGLAAAISVVAMVAFNIFALNYQLDGEIAPQILTAAMHSVELA